MNHTNICGPKLSRWEKGYRDFESLDEMNSTIINNMNEVIMPDDTLYFLGDFLFGHDKMENFKRFWDRIVCRNRVFLKGNHSTWMDKNGLQAEAEKIVGKIHNVLEVNINGYDFWMSHYRPEEYYSRDKPHHVSSTRKNRVTEFSGSGFVRNPRVIYLWAHEHNSIPDDPNSLGLEIGVDTFHYGHKKYYPYSFEEIINIMKTHKTPPLT